ncbi:MAG: alpha-glucosidase C-terminal domain-containing protein [Gomphosphaeria aponina SAG 52.96 = DSM 107014]|uniref:Alpha-glucosidase C-terminal domain-containing protein n=1 Tax=Gomphosphaeria aponina SAG 52.96 = DSM 107014 TaxID=1521640 RepID=A0A941JPE4_9CHRO|nr:alpha-glucosidase C-terminal domain-containing protein [Gomphosphaeria aponina SAG 52.96 = DSM 107014]
MESNQLLEHFSARVKPLLEKLYDQETQEKLLEELFLLLKEHFAPQMQEDRNKWSENNVQLITYGDSIIHNGEKPLQTLNHFLDQYVGDTITGVHILPFFPYTSDDGFAVIDYLSVSPELGDWEDIKPIAKKFNLMVDLVINHVSSKSIWFEQFKQGKKPGCDYFIEVDPSIDLSQVVRPRSTPLLTKVETVKGEKYVWSTFSEDQIDVNFANPDVLIEYIKIILFYVQIGAKFIRLDAVGFLWKKIGTSCIHLPETHAVVRLLREILQMLNPAVSLITETNVPNRENLTYFGNRNEAHMVYNFSLPPLLLNALLQGKSDHLKTWMMRMPPVPMGCAYFNFTASHDGIGLRPAEGLLSDDEYQTLLEMMEKFGGKISMRKNPDGTESPYEINISWFDAMKGTAQGEDVWQIERFLCSQTMMMAFDGIPAFYIHSLLATPNDLENLEKKEMNRAINRHKWDYEELAKRLNEPQSTQHIVLKELARRIKIRRSQPAFHPNATQYTLHPLNNGLFTFWRQSIYREQSIFCINNLTNTHQPLSLTDLNLFDTENWYDLISGEEFADLAAKLSIKPYQCLWITNKYIFS